MGLYLCRLLGGIPEAAEGGKPDRSEEGTEQKDAGTETDQSDIEINLLTGSNRVIGFGSSTKVSARVKYDSQEIDLITVNWQKVENNVPVTLNLNTVKYSGSSLKLPTPELVINDAEQGDAGVYQLNVVSTTSTVTSEPVVVELQGDPVESISKEERNFVRFSLLCQNLGSKAVLLYFNKHVPEPTLASHLNTHRKDLNYITGNRAWKCNREQFNVLFPVYPTVAKASDFDISLIYKLIRNTINVNPPTQGWGNTPLTGDVSEEDDVERVRYYRNKLAHNTDFKIQDGDFTTMWDELSEGLKRLGGSKITSDVESLKKKALDNKTKIQVIENIKNLKQDVELLEQEIQEMKERLNNPIPPHIQGGMETTLQTWTELDQVFYYQTRAYKAALEKVQSCQVVTLIGGPGSGKTATARHIALEFKQKGWDIVPVCEISKILDYAKQDKRQVFVIDDLLGVLSLDTTLWNVANSHRERIDGSLHCDSKLICTSRKQIHKQSIGLSFSFFENFVDLEAKEIELNEHEMRCMLENHCVARNVDATIYSKISTDRRPFMFPLLCYCFSTNSNYQTKGSMFFDNPYECMLEQLNLLCKLNPLQYSVLVLCLLNDNNLCLEQVDVECKESVYNTCGVNRSTSDKQLRDALYQLTEVYLIKKNEVYTFIHDSIYEIIGHHYGKENVKMILKYMPHYFVWNKLTVGNVKLGDELSINVDENMYTVLAEHMWYVLSNINELNLCEHLLTHKDESKNKIPVDPVHVLTGKSFQVLLGFEPFVETFLSKLQTQSIECIKSIFKSRSLIVNDRDMPYLRLPTQNDTSYDLCYTYLFLNHTAHISFIKKSGYPQCYLDEELDYLDKELDSSGEELDNLDKDLDSSGEELDYLDKDLDSSGEELDYDDNVMDLENLGTLHDSEDIFDVRFISWVVHYNQSYLLKVIIDYINSINHQMDIIIGDKEEQTRLLVLACFCGNLDIVKILLQYLGKSSVNNSLMDINPYRLSCEAYRDHRRYTPIQAACRCTTENLELVKYLVQIGADINKCGPDSIFPIHSAASFGHQNIVKYLLEVIKSETNQNESHKSYLNDFCIVDITNDNKPNCKRNMINQFDSFGESPLLLASKNGFTKIVKILINEGADVNLCNDSNESPLYHASLRGHIKIVKCLIDKGAKINLCNDSNISPLYQASVKGNTQIVKLLFDNGADVNLCNQSNESPLYQASGKGHSEIVKLLIDNGADVNLCNQSNKSPLYQASGEGHTEIVKLLIDNGADVNLCNQSNESPLYQASGEGHSEIVKHLIDNGAEVNISTYSNQSPLYQAFLNGNTEIVKLLIEKGADVNLCTHPNSKLLYLTSKWGHSEIVKILIDKGANVNIFTYPYQSPLYHASLKGHTEIVKLLIEKGADVNLCIRSNESLLYSVCRSWTVSNNIINNFIFGIGPNLCSNVLPLHPAPISRYTEIVKLLIDNGAEVNLCNQSNESPLNQAIRTGHIEIVKLLIDEGADINICSISNESPLLCACALCSEHIEIVKIFLDKGAEVNLCNKSNESPLYTASWRGHAEIVKLLIDEGAEVNLCDNSNESPLYQASERGHTEIVKLLIDKGAEVNLCDNSNESPLYQASRNGHTECVKLLIDNGAKVNLCDKSNNSPLYHASNKGHINIVKLLIDKGAEVNLCNKSYQSPLYQASRKGHTEIVKLLTDKGAKVNLCDKSNDSPLYHASSNGHINIVKLLIDKGAEVNLCNKSKESPLYQASRKGHTEIVKLLTDKGAKVNLFDKSNDSPLYQASSNGHTKIVKLLIDKGAEVNLCNKSYQSPLYQASLIGHIELVKLLIEKGAKVNLCNKTNESPLHGASLRGHIEIVKLLIDKGAEINIRNTLNMSPLYSALVTKHTEIVKLLIKNGADIKLCNKANESPLYQASFRGLIEVVKLLIDKGAAVNQCNNSKESPLYQASRNGHTEIVKLLIDNGAEVNLCNNSKESPLYQASRNGHTEIVKLLIDNGAEVNLCNNSKESPLYQASRNGHTEIVKFLIDNGAEVNLCNKSIESPLFQATGTGHTKIVKLLIDKGAKLNICNTSNESPLYSACESYTEHAEIVKLLIDKGADVNLCNSSNESPLFQASRNGHTEIVKLLINKGAEVNICNTSKESALYSACQSDTEHAEIVKLLIDKGAEVNLCNNSKESPLYQASRNGHTEIVKLLIDKGVEVNLCDNSKESPLYQASRNGHTEIVKLLIDNGAENNLCNKSNQSPLYQASGKDILKL